MVVCGHEGMLGDGGGDHAGAYETSLGLALTPTAVLLERLDVDPPDEPAGVRGEHPRESTAVRGEATVAAFVAGCRDRLGDVPPPRPLAAPDEDGTLAEWIPLRRT
jgi:creatinine amidohydrolase/Fe(II)-dependent formamide hydrolase-like protein